MKNTASLTLFSLLKTFYHITKYILPLKLIRLEHGWDTIHAMAPYSYMGCSRSKFLSLYTRQIKDNKSISWEEYQIALFGCSTPSNEDENSLEEIRKRMKNNFG